MTSLQPQTRTTPKGRGQRATVDCRACLPTNVLRRTKSELAEGGWMSYFRRMCISVEDHLLFAMKHSSNKAGEGIRVPDVIRRVIVDAFTQGG